MADLSSCVKQLGVESIRRGFDSKNGEVVC